MVKWTDNKFSILVLIVFCVLCVLKNLGGGGRPVSMRGLGWLQLATLVTPDDSL